MPLHLSERLLALWLFVAIAMLPHAVAGQVADSTVSCAAATAEAFLDVGNVRAKIMNNGGQFWNGGQNVYEVPKGGGVNAIFAASFWLGGMVNDSLRMAATTYGPWEFWPGPGPPEGVSLETCARYDRLYELTREDVSGHSPAADQRIQDWPVEVGAPFIDVDGDGRYEPADGDRPELLGDQQQWWIMNDLSGEHALTKTDAMKVEVRATAFAFDAPGAVGNSTFYRYRIRNTSSLPITRTWAGLYVDADLGAAFDDYIGSDSTLGLGFNYNADNDDNDAYGAAPPAIGYTVLSRPESSLVHSVPGCGYPDGKSTGFTNVMLWPNGAGVVGYRPTAADLYGFLQSQWRGGRSLTMGGNGRDYTDDPVLFAFPGDPVAGAYWSERNADDEGSPTPPADRRLTNGLGPFCIAAGEEVELVIAIVWSRGSSNLDSVRKLKEDVAYLQSIRDILLTPRSLPATEVPVAEVPFALGIYPNPAGLSGATVRLSLPEPMGTRVHVYDALGRLVHEVAKGAFRRAGEHQWTLPARDWAAGVYLVRIQAGPAVTTRRLVVTPGT